MLRQAEAEAVTATAVATATVIANATPTARTTEFYNWILIRSESSGECFQICSYTSLLGCFAGIIFRLKCPRRGSHLFFYLTACLIGF